MRAYRETALHLLLYALCGLQWRCHCNFGDAFSFGGLQPLSVASRGQLKRLESQPGDSEGPVETTVPPVDAAAPQRGDKNMAESIPKLNSVVMTGRVGQDPAPRYFDDGNCVVNFSLAVKREYHPLERKARAIKYGEEETDWWPVEIWGREAEYCAKIIRRGMRVGIRGSFAINTWSDNEGHTRRKPKLVVAAIELLESRSEIAAREASRGGGGNFQQQGSYQRYQQRESDEEKNGDFSYSEEGQAADDAASADWWPESSSSRSGLGSANQDAQVSSLLHEPSTPASDSSPAVAEEKLPSFFDDF